MYPAFVSVMLLLSSVSGLLADRHYRFQAQYANPQGGQQIMLSPAYFDLTVKGDTLVSFLPYYGRAYSASLNPDDAGFKFTTTQFAYTEKKSKNGWDIVIVPKDNDVQKMFLSVSSDGNATLSVISNTRQSISFNGVIVANEDRR